ncbi:MAG: hypothetical protein EZS28_025447 [Streblomastix strix]|uniref:Uncharacterized protein n=1 Tax=Streblomastix strix TaxID=222440 RepID=A0A5J4V921_9EUKA|nr:MAG: hypothetical protein EZS28_025447 [Streblomastix strix]
MRLKREIIPSYPQFEEMRRKLAEQSDYLQGYSDKGRQLRKKSGYQLLGVAVDDAEKNQQPLAPQMLPKNHPFLKNGPPIKWLQKQVNKMIYSKSQIADIQATRQLKSIFDTPWFQEYTEQIEKRNYRDVAKLQFPQFDIYETEIPDQITSFPELTKEQKKSTLRFGYVNSDSDYEADQDDQDEEEIEDEPKFKFEDVQRRNLFDFIMKRKKKQKNVKEKEKERGVDIEMQQLQETPSPETLTDKQNQQEQGQEQQQSSSNSSQLIQTEPQSQSQQSIQSSQTNSNLNSSEQQPNKRLTPSILNQEERSQLLEDKDENISEFPHSDNPESITHTSPLIKDGQE